MLGDQAREDEILQVGCLAPSPRRSVPRCRALTAGYGYRRQRGDIDENAADIDENTGWLRVAHAATRTTDPDGVAGQRDATSINSRDY
jgi:hypothetical protein